MICKTVRRLFGRAHLSFGIALFPQPLLPILGEGEPEQLLKVPLPGLGEGFRERATKVRCSLPTRNTGILILTHLRLI
jgi:hypothetical protein